MSIYGPPGGQYPGQPSDPWQQNDPYGQPSGQPSGAPYPTSPYGPPDPWSTPPASPAGAGQPGYGQSPFQQPDPYLPPGYGQPAPGYGQQPPYGQGPAWGAPAPPPKKRSVGGIVALVIVLVLVLCGGGVTGLYFIGRQPHPPTPPVGQNSQGVDVSPNSEPTADTTAPADSPAAQDAITTVQEGQCVENQGTNDNARLVIKPCGPGTYKVVRRIDGVAASSECDGVKDSDYWFTYNTTTPGDDVTLCLKKQ